MSARKDVPTKIALLGLVARGLYGLVHGTTRPIMREDYRELLDAFERREQVILAFWHGNLAVLQNIYRSRGPGICIQISPSNDGEILSRAVARHRIRTARGSASQGGVSSLREMMQAWKEGYDLGISPDGPRGPRHEAKLGGIRMAQATGARLFPIAGAAERRFVSRRSWDRFTIPIPFSRVHYTVGAPITVARGASDAELEQKRLDLAAELGRISIEAERRAGRP